MYPDLELIMSLTDRLVDMTQEGVDCALRVGSLQDSSLIGRQIGSMQFATLMVEKSGVVVSPGVAFGEHGEGFVRIAMVENEQRIRQAARNLRRFLESGLETLHNVVPLANRR